MVTSLEGGFSSPPDSSLCVFASSSMSFSPAFNVVSIVNVLSSKVRCWSVFSLFLSPMCFITLLIIFGTCLEGGFSPEVPPVTFSHCSTSNVRRMPFSHSTFVFDERASLYKIVLSPVSGCSIVTVSAL